MRLTRIRRTEHVAPIKRTRTGQICSNNFDAKIFITFHIRQNFVHNVNLKIKQNQKFDTNAMVSEHLLK